MIWSLLGFIFTADYWRLVPVTLAGLSLLALPWLPVVGGWFLWRRFR